VPAAFGHQPITGSTAVEIHSSLLKAALPVGRALILFFF
jgi:hypothetical protein